MPERPDHREGRLQGPGDWRLSGDRGSYGETGYLLPDPAGNGRSLGPVNRHRGHSHSGDGDTGHGGVLNVARTVREFERAGAAGLFIEDQVFPKRCGHMEGKQVVGREDMVAKIKAALDARKDPDLIITAERMRWPF